MLHSLLKPVSGVAMNLMSERRLDDAMRAVVTQAIEFRKTLGQAGAVLFLVEHHVPPPVLQRVLIQTSVSDVLPQGTGTMNPAPSLAG
ncbi:MAG: hypothetical protein NVSMB6_14510 [Burkholderiaceae bacterium]